MSVRINGQELPADIREVKVVRNNVEIDGALVVIGGKVEIDIEADMVDIVPTLRGYIEKSMRVNDP